MHSNEKLNERNDLETGTKPDAVIDLSVGSRSLIARESPPDGEFEELLTRFQGRDDEPITGLTAEQFALEGVHHPERYRFLVNWLANDIGTRDPTRIVD